MGLTIAGATDEALAMLEDLRRAAEATDNPAVLGYALLARGLAYRYTDGRRRVRCAPPGPDDRSETAAMN